MSSTPPAIVFIPAYPIYTARTESIPFLFHTIKPPLMPFPTTLARTHTHTHLTSKSSIQSRRLGGKRAPHSKTHIGQIGVRGGEFQSTPRSVYARMNVFEELKTHSSRRVRGIGMMLFWWRQIPLIDNSGGGGGGLERW